MASEHSSIEWTEARWNATSGCTKVSPGCDAAMPSESRSGSADISDSLVFGHAPETRAEDRPTPVSTQRFSSRSQEPVLEDVHAMVVKVGALLSGEIADAHTGVDAPSIEKLAPDFWDDQQLLASGEADVALVEQVIDVRRQQQSVGTVEALGIVGVSP